MSSPAVAQDPANPDEPRTTADPAPNCVEGLVVGGGDYGTVRVRNGCSDRQRAKVIVAWGPDSRCFNLEPGDVEFHEMDDFTGPFPDPRYDGLVKC